MITSFLRGLSGISRYFRFDILWRISKHLSAEDRRYLSLRLLRSEAKQITFRRGGNLWTGNLDDSTILTPLFARGHYHMQDIDALLSWMNTEKRLTASRNVILDIGANIGTTAIPFSQKTDAHILAIEPLPKNFQLLQRNVSQNGLEHRITCVQKAVYKQAACLEMVIPVGNHGGAFINAKGTMPDKSGLLESENCKTMQVSAEPLMKILEDCNILPDQVAFVWCDTEGCEDGVIETGAPLWQQGVPIYLEINPDALEIQNSLQQFPGLVAQYFNRYVESTELVRQGNAAVFRPISELSHLCRDLHRIKGKITDVLLLPAGFDERECK